MVYSSSSWGWKSMVLRTSLELFIYIKYELSKVFHSPGVVYQDMCV